jgi:hypothetical protein
MPANYAVAAHVVDIRNDAPRASDIFLVDTNVWLWLGYPKKTCAPSEIARSAPYLAFVKAARGNNAKLLRCGLSLAEIAHLIEKHERTMFETSTGRPVGSLLPKEYRHNYPAEWPKVASEIQAAWQQAVNLADLLTVSVDGPATDATLSRLQNQRLDGYDLFILEATSKAGVAQILTDDGDYCTVPGIQMFTANRNVLESARQQGKLLRR